MDDDAFVTGGPIQSDVGAGEAYLQQGWQRRDVDRDRHGRRQRCRTRIVRCKRGQDVGAGRHIGPGCEPGTCHALANLVCASEELNIGDAAIQVASGGGNDDASQWIADVQDRVVDGICELTSGRSVALELLDCGE